MPVTTNRSKYARIFAYGIAAIVFAYGILSAIPQKNITIATGPVRGTYYEISLKYKALLEKKGYRVNIVSLDNTSDIARRVNDSQSNIDVGFVAQELRDKNLNNIVSMGDIQLQPVFLFTNHAPPPARKISTIADLKGMRVVLLPEQSVTSQAALKIFSLFNINKHNTSITFLPLVAAIESLKSGKFDAGLFILSAENELIVELAKNRNLDLIGVSQINSIAKKLPFLQHALLPAGSYDLGENIPAADVPLLAARISIVVKKTLAPGIAYSLLDVMTEVHREGTYLSKPHEFPSYIESDVPVHAVVPDFYRSGTPWIFSHLPMWLASVIDRYLVTFLGVWFSAGAWKGLMDIKGLRKFVSSFVFQLVLKQIQRSIRHSRKLSARQLWIVGKIEDWIVKDEERMNLKALIFKLKTQ